MNKIYSKVWNKSLGCLVVASELVSSQSDGMTASPAHRPARAGMLICSITLALVAMLGISPSAHASYYTFGGGSACSATGTTAVGPDGVVSQTQNPLVDGSGNWSNLAGCSANGNGQFGVTLFGAFTTVTGDGGSAFGLGSRAGLWSTALGMQAQATGQSSFAGGYNAKASALDTVAIGSGGGTSAANATIASATGAVAIGGNATKGAQATGTNAIAIGGESAAVGITSIAIGKKASAAALGSTNIAIGNDTVATGTAATLGDALAIGAAAKATGQDSTAIGGQTTASATNTLAIGNNGTSATKIGATAFGAGAQATGAQSLATGNTATASADNSAAIGSGAKATHANSVALGVNSVTAAPHTGAFVIAGSAATAAGVAPMGVVSVGTGAAGGERQIQNVGAGQLASTSTDAVNGSQLHATNQQVLQNTDALDSLHYLSVNSAASGTGSNRDNDGATGLDAVAVGPGANAQGVSGVAVGDGVVSGALGQNVAIGSDTTADSNSNDNPEGAVAIGRDQHATGDGAVAIGSSNTSTGNGSVVLGRASDATGTGSLALGDSTKSTGSRSIALGSTSSATFDSAVAIGNGAKANTGLGAIAIGRLAASSAADAIAMGSSATTTAAGALALGKGTNVSGANSVALGTSAISSGNSSAAIGREAKAYSTESLALGLNATAGTSGGTTIRNYAIGSQSLATGGDAIALGDYSQATAAFTSALGEAAKATGASSTALGVNSQAAGTRSLAAGSGASAAGTNGVALGAGSIATNAGDVALGSSSVTAAAVGTTDTIINGVNYGFAGTAPLSVVSVGNEGSERQLTNVAAGRVSGTSTDAVNGSQLFATNAAVGTVGDRVTVNEGDIVDLDDRVTTNEGDITTLQGDVAGNTTDIAALQDDALLWDPTANGGAGAYSANHGGTGPNKITNVADGTLAAGSTDAVNGSQLNATNQSILDLGDVVDANKTHYYSVNDNGTHGANFDNDGAQGTGSIAAGIGASTTLAAANSIALGSNAVSGGVAAVAVGVNAQADFQNDVAFGANAHATGDASGLAPATAFGNGATASHSADTAFGALATATGGQSLALGYGATSSGLSSAAFGTQASSTAKNSVALGGFTYADGDYSTAVGGATASAEKSIAIGDDASADAAALHGIALGDNAIVSTARSVALGDASTTATAVGTPTGTIGGTTYNYAGATPVGTVSVGNAASGDTRTITNVAAGRVLEDSTDAINGSQLYAAHQKVGDNTTNIAGNTTDIAALQDDALLWDPTANGGAGAYSANHGGTGPNKITNLADGALAAGSTDAVNGSQLYATNQSIQNLGDVVDANKTHFFSVNATTGGNYDNDGATGDVAIAVGLRASASGDHAVAIGLDASSGGLDSIAVGYNASAAGINGVAVGGGSRATTDYGVAIGWDARVTSGTKGVALGYRSRTAPTVATTEMVVNGTTYSVAGSAPDGTVSIGGNPIQGAANRTLTNVSAGRVSGTSTDAVNGSQLFATNTAVGTLGDRVTVNEGDIADLDDRVTTNEGDITTLQGDVAGNTTDIAALQDDALLWDPTANGGAGAYSANHGGSGPNKITNVADGTVAVGSTDAVNGSQLNATNQSILDLGDVVDANKTHYFSVNDNGVQGGNYDNDGATATNAIAIGPNAVASATGALVIGNGAKTTTTSARDAIVIGTNAQARDSSTIAIGRDSAAQANGLAIGAGSTATGPGSLALGLQAVSVGISSIALGQGAMAGATNSVSIGKGAGAGGTAANTGNVAIGLSSGINVQGVNNTGVGSQSGREVTGAYNSALGYGAGLSVVGSGNVAMGANAGSGVLAGATVTINDTVAVGNASLASANDAVALGHNAKAVNVGDVALGNGSVTAAPHTGAFTIDGSAAAGASAASVVSVGTGVAGGERQIQNVGAGVLSATSTDAVNGSQLFATNTAVGALGDRVTVNEGDITALQDDALLWDPAANGGAGAYSANHGGTGPNKITNVAAGTAATDAVNKSQLDDLSDNAVQYDDATKGTVTLGGVTSTDGGLTNGTVIGNVAQGDVSNGSTEAVNGTQLWETNQDVAQNATDITNLDGRVTVNEGAITQIGDTITALAGDTSTTYTDANGVGIRYARTNEAGLAAIDSYAQGQGSTAVGYNAVASAGNAVALGRDTTASHADSVALGSNSATTVGAQAAYTGYAVGASSSTGEVNIGGRKLTGVAAGEIDSDGVNVSQLKAVDSKLDDLSDNAVQYDDATKGSVTLGNGTSSVDGGVTGGTTITNVHQGDVSNGSTDAVNGTQLWETNQDVAQNATDITNLDGRVTVNEGNITQLGDTITTLAGDTSTAYTDANGVGIRYTRTNEAGLAAIDSYAQGQGSTAVGYNAVAAADNALAIGRDAVAGHADSVALGANSVTMVGAQVAYTGYAVGASSSTGEVNIGGRKLTGLAAGEIDSDGVNVSQLKAVDSKLDDLSDNAVQYDDATKGTVTLGGATSTDGGLTGGTKITNVAQGDVSDGSTDAVNGTQLNETNENVAQNATNIANNATAITTLDGRVTTIEGNITNIGNGSVGMFQVSQDHNTPPPAPTGADSAAGGANATASGGASLAVGNNSTASGDNSSALGNGATASGTGSTAVGQGATAAADGSVALGNGASDGGRGAESYTGAYSGAQNDTVGTVSVGNAATGETRTVSNVADGKEATDAVNLRQLDGAVQAANDYTDTQISNITSDVTNVAGTVNNLQKGADGMFQVSQDANAAKPQATGTNAVAGGNNAVASGNSGTAVGNDTVASGESSTALGNGAQATAANSVAIGAGSTADRANSVSVGSSGAERQITNVAAGTAKTDAANVGQLEAIQAASVQYDRNPDGSIDYTSITVNQGGAATTIHNVNAGTAATDAVNVGQLDGAINKAIDWSTSYTDQRFDTLNKNVNAIGNRANGGIASAMAMASLPQAYAPNQSAAAVALGNFHGETGIAVGVSTITESGRYVFKLNATSNTRGDTGVGVGAAVVW